MKLTHRSIVRTIGMRRRRGRGAAGRPAGTAGFTLIELVISVGIMSLIMGGTMLALAQAARANETALLVTSMNNGLRTGMDMMIRDLLQVGSGLPPGHSIQIPCCTSRVNLPGPPGPTRQTALGDTEIYAVMQGTRLGPLVNQNGTTTCTVEGPDCVKTDTLLTIAADSTFRDVPLKARDAAGTWIDVALKGLDNIAGNADDINIASGPDRVVPGQLIMLEKGSYTVLLQVTDVNGVTGRIYFADGDSLALNKHTANSGSVAGANGLNNWAPSPDVVPETTPVVRTTLHTTATRVRMITYYIDATDPLHPKLVRRLNNGHQTNFDNNSGSVVAFDVENLKISFDMADGKTNPANVTFVASDYLTGGPCFNADCSPTQVRKVTITLTGRSKKKLTGLNRFFHNTLTTQIALRGMAFVNDYVQ